MTDPASTRLPAELFTRPAKSRRQRPRMPQLPELPALPPLAGVAGGALQTLMVRWRRSPLEISALALLILAGLIYPFPIWLIGFLLWAGGAAMVGISRAWAGQDKFVGLAVPVIVAFVGTALALASGGEHDTFQPYAHEIASTGSLLLRITIILGGLYLAWQARRGRREPLAPPWQRPDRRYWDRS